MMIIKTPSLLSTILATLLTCEVLAPVEGNQCYVCHSDNPEDQHQLRKTFPGDNSIPACSSFHLSSDLSRFTRTCPESGGCLTKTSQEGGVMRTCSRVRVDDCKVANGVTYCYCNTDNCNGQEEDKGVKEHSGAGAVETRYLPAAAPYVVKYPDNTHVDDEDSVEEEGGSGNYYYPEYSYGEENYNYYGENTDYEEYSGDEYAPDDRRWREKDSEREDIVLVEDGGNRWRPGSSGASRRGVLWVVMVSTLLLLRRSWL